MFPYTSVFYITMLSVKRTITERDSVQTEEIQQERDVLILKLPTKRERGSSVLRECLTLEDDETIIENLLLINESTYPRILPSLDMTMTSLKDLWEKYQTNLPICTIIINILGKLLPQVTYLANDHQKFLLSLLSHSSADIKALVLKCWKSVAKGFSTEFSTQCLKDTVEVIYSPSHTLRMECLNLIGHLSHMAPTHDALLLLVTEFCSDCDSRVRKAALQALLTMYQVGIILGLPVYNKTCELLKDDDESVRCTAVTLVHALGSANPDSMIPLAQDQSISLKLKDDAFIKTCNMVTDASVHVRALAASLLGQFSDISEHFLLQTLDKKLMSHLQVVKSDHDRARELHGAGGGGTHDWDTGQRWGSGVPKINLDPSEVTLMRSGSCGAFVHCIEDEYMEVRLSAIVSLGKLCQQNQVFAGQCMDFLIDMINDEIENVRLQAILTLRQVSASIDLREDQLETVLGVLQESSLEIREAIHSLLAHSHVTTQTEVHKTVHALLDNLNKYPCDRQSIWNCLQVLGGSHAYLVSILTPELLSIHPYFMSKEPDINDPAYICILILVFNAANTTPTLVSLFPPHVFRHYSYLRDTLPDLIPQLKIMGQNEQQLFISPQQSSSSNIGEKYLKQLLSKALDQLHNSSVTMATLKQCCHDLNKLAGVEPILKGCALFSSQLLHCQILTNNISQSLSVAVLASSGTSDIATNVRELLLLSYRLQWGYIGHAPSLLLLLYQLRVIAHCSLIQLAIQLDWPLEQSNKFDQLKESLTERLQSLQELCNIHCLTCPVSVQSLVNKDLVTMATDQLTYFIQNMTSSVSILSDLQLSDLQHIQQCQVILDEQSDHTHKDTPLKFLSSLALSLPITGVIHNVKDTPSLSIQIKFPDGRVLLFTPKPSEYRPLTPTTQKLSHTIIISHGKWTDPLMIEVVLLRQYQPDTSTDKQCLNLLNKLINKGTKGHVKSACCAGDGVGEVVISDTVMFNIFPQDTLSKGFNVFGPT